MMVKRLLKLGALQKALPDGRSIRKLASEVRCSRSHLTNVRNGKKLPSLGLAKRLADHLGLPLEQLFP